MKPRRLEPGATFGVVAPASPIDPGVLDRGVERLRSLGFRVVLGKHVAESVGDFAGEDVDRARDLWEMLHRDDVDGVICARGGLGSLRTVLELKKLLMAGPPPAPKPFIGFSDVTFLHAFLRVELGWTTFHGPMLASLSERSEYTWAAFQKALFDASPFEVSLDPRGLQARTLVEGVAEGELVGGWLGGLGDLTGTPWEQDLRGKILFFEDVRQSPREIDRSLCRLVAAGRLDQCAGIIIGEHEQCGSYERLEPIFRAWVVRSGVPTVSRLPIGHGPHMATLPLGIRARLDATQRRLTILEPGVT